MLHQTTVTLPVEKHWYSLFKVALLQRKNDVELLISL